MKCIVLFVVFSFLYPAEALAYLDPGSGGILFQILAAIAITIGIFWRKIKRLFKRNKAEEDEINKAVQDIVEDNQKDK